MKNKSYEEQMELIQELAAICQELGWTVGVPSESGDTVPGLIIGTNDFIYNIVAQCHGTDDVNKHIDTYETNEFSEIEETQIQKPDSTQKKKSILH